MEAKANPTNIAESLLGKKLLTPVQLAKAEKARQENGKSVLEAVSEMGFVASDDLLEFAATELSVPFLRLSRIRIAADILSLVPRKLAVTYQVIPISKINDVLMIAMADPRNAHVIEDLKRVTGMQVVPILSAHKDIVESLEAHFTDDASEKLKDVVRDLEVNMTLIEEKKENVFANVSELLNLTQEMPVVKLTDHILNEGVRRRASDIFVEPQEKEMVIRYRVDGVLQEGPKPPRSMHRGIVSRIKIMSNLDIAEHRLPQDGRCKIKVQSRDIDFRVSTVPTYFGEKVCMRILDGSAAKLDIKVLGFDEHSLKCLAAAATRPYGMILTCGPTGSGKTTTLYSMLSDLNTIERNIVTIEDPVEYAIRGINQVNARSEVGLTFGAALRSILRQDPDVILVGEIRDNETADIAVKAALTGHLVLSTLHTNTAVGCIVRLANMGVEPFLITSSLILAASQRLIRKLCPECKEEYEPSAELKKHLEISGALQKPFYKPKGCARCMNFGYLGRSCVIETLTITSRVKELIMRKAPEKEIKDAAREEGMVTLRENAVAKLKQGMTSAEEVLRVTASDEVIGS